jgi:phenol/toluene 2-monooxygenase (NADH) P3/A3
MSTNTPTNTRTATDAARKLSLRDKYALMTRGLGWEPSYETHERLYDQVGLEGIKIHDWNKWEDPFRLTMDAYWKYQAEKERKLYAVLDAFQQNNGHLNISDARYVNTLKLFFTGITPAEYNAHRLFAMLGRQFPGTGAAIACQMQSIDELRHVQTQVHSISHYNKHFSGLHDHAHMNDRVWYLSVPKSFFEDALSSGPFEQIIAISFALEYLLTNLVFMPFMSGAAYNGDMATVTFGFSSQSDEARHMTLGLECLKFVLEQDPANVPIVQAYLDKWFWRGYKMLGLVSMMLDYMLPKKVMSWKEAWNIYFVQNGGSLFNDLSRYGIRMPKYWEQTVKEAEHLSHQTWNSFYNFAGAAAFHVWLPSDEDMAWLSEKYPETFDRLYRPRIEFYREQAAKGQRFSNDNLPMLCQTCQIPLIFTETDQPGDISHREERYMGEAFHFCSDGCRDIFCAQPEKYVRAWLPAHQILQGNCFTAEANPGAPGFNPLAEVFKYYHLQDGQDNGDYAGSVDEANWQRWTDASPQTATPAEPPLAASAAVMPEVAPAV